MDLCKQISDEVSSDMYEIMTAFAFICPKRCLCFPAGAEFIEHGKPRILVYGLTQPSWRQADGDEGQDRDASGGKEEDPSEKSHSPYSLNLRHNCTRLGSQALPVVVA
eukprot:1854385-Amphidinium_carterae.1